VEKVVQSLPSVLIFMDKFVEDSPFVTQEVLEACLPYALLRSMYKQLYDTKTQGKKGNHRTQHTIRHDTTHKLIGGRCVERAITGKAVLAAGGGAGEQAEDNM
jgi:hypothetical protein